MNLRIIALKYACFFMLSPPISWQKLTNVQFTRSPWRHFPATLCNCHREPNCAQAQNARINRHLTTTNYLISLWHKWLLLHNVCNNNKATKQRAQKPRRGWWMRAYTHYTPTRWIDSSSLSHRSKWIWTDLIGATNSPRIAVPSVSCFRGGRQITQSSSWWSVSKLVI